MSAIKQSAAWAAMAIAPWAAWVLVTLLVHD